MRRTITGALVLMLVAAATAQTDARLTSTKAARDETSFSAPVRLKDGDRVIRTEAPGYASPCWADVTGDGKKDLLVGQFAGGKIKIYPGLGKGRIGKGKWLEIDGKVAEVPGVW